jgi:hypothetical protein
MTLDFNLNIISLSSMLLSLGGAVFGVVKYAHYKEDQMRNLIDQKADKATIDTYDKKIDHITDRIDHIYDHLINGKSHDERKL